MRIVARTNLVIRNSLNLKKHVEKMINVDGFLDDEQVRKIAHTNTASTEDQTPGRLLNCVDGGLAQIRYPHEGYSRARVISTCVWGP